MTEPLELPSGAVVTISPPVPPAVEPAPPAPTSLTFLPSPGPRGQVGPAGDNAPVYGEIPGGALNGVNTIFTTANPYVPGSTAVYLNGLREFLGEGYDEVGPNSINFTDAPLSADRIRIDYIVTS